MSQNSYGIDQAAASLGMVADSSYTNTDSKIAKSVIPVGRGVSKVFGVDDQVRLPAANQGTVTFDADLLTANTIDLDVNGTSIDTVTFGTDHATTMALIAVEIAKHPSVLSATVSAARVITVIGIDSNVILITDIVVASGTTQANGTAALTTRDTLYGIARLTQALEGGMPNGLATINRGTIFFDADLVASNTIDFDINGSSISQVTFSSDHDTTMALIIVEILLNANVAAAVLDADDTNNRTIIITAILGVDLAVTGITVASGSSQAIGYWTGGTRSVVPSDNLIPQYAINATANVLRRGPIWVYFETAFNPDSHTLYCRFIEGSSDNQYIGQFRNSNDSSKAFAVAGNFVVKSTLTAAGMGIIELNKPA